MDSLAVVHKLSSCGTGAYLLLGVWDLDLPTAILLLSPGLGDMAAVCLLGNRRVLPDFSLPQALSRPAEPAPPCWGPGDTVRTQLQG